MARPKKEITENRVAEIETPERKEDTKVTIRFAKTAMGTYGVFYKGSILTVSTEFAQPFIESGDATICQ